MRRIILFFMITTLRRFVLHRLHRKGSIGINYKIEKMWLSTTTLNSIWASWCYCGCFVSCLYGIELQHSKNIAEIKQDQVIVRTMFLKKLVQSLYSWTEGEFNRGNLEQGDNTVEVFFLVTDMAFRIHFLRWDWRNRSFGPRICRLKIYEVSVTYPKMVLLDFSRCIARCY
jgi:hypothetical protein